MRDGTWSAGPIAIAMDDVYGWADGDGAVRARSTSVPGPAELIGRMLPAGAEDDVALVAVRLRG